MCGITGYIGEPITFYEALKHVPFWRGGDGVGIMYIEDDSIRVKKSEGDIANIIKVILDKQKVLSDGDKYKLPDFSLKSPLWIIHNRQGTRGSNKIENNHPFYLPKYEKWVMQNGTVSGLDFYRNLMLFRGVGLKSETDSELLGYLVQEDIMPRVTDVLENIKTDRGKNLDEYVITPFNKLCNGGFGVYIIIDPKSKKIEVLKDDERSLWLTRLQTGIWFTSELIMPPSKGKSSQEEVHSGYIRFNIQDANIEEYAYMYTAGTKDFWKTLAKGEPIASEHTTCDVCHKYRFIFKSSAKFDICWECIRDNFEKFDTHFRDKLSTETSMIGWDNMRESKLIHKLQRFYTYVSGRGAEALQDEKLCQVQTFYKKSHTENDRRDYEEIVFMRGVLSG